MGWKISAIFKKIKIVFYIVAIAAIIVGVTLSSLLASYGMLPFSLYCSGVILFVGLIFYEVCSCINDADFLWPYARRTCGHN